MKFLVDNNLSPKLASGLSQAGHDAVHTREVGLRRADDPDLIDYAVEHDRTVLSADTDFGALLAERGSDRPSIVLVRRSANRSAATFLACCWRTFLSSKTRLQRERL